jgi:hypothetical protein
VAGILAEVLGKEEGVLDSEMKQGELEQPHMKIVRARRGSGMSL